MGRAIGTALHQSLDQMVVSAIYRCRNVADCHFAFLLQLSERLDLYGKNLVLDEIEWDELEEIATIYGAPRPLDASDWQRRLRHPVRVRCGFRHEFSARLVAAECWP